MPLLKVSSILAKHLQWFYLNLFQKVDNREDKFWNNFFCETTRLLKMLKQIDLSSVAFLKNLLDEI